MNMNWKRILFATWYILSVAVIGVGIVLAIFGDNSVMIWGAIGLCLWFSTVLFIEWWKS
jgi:hypothetical protein